MAIIPSNWDLCYNKLGKYEKATWLSTVALTVTSLSYSGPESRMNIFGTFTGIALSQFLWFSLNQLFLRLLDTITWFLLSLLLTSNKFHLFFWHFYYWHWTYKYRLEGPHIGFQCIFQAKEWVRDKKFGPYFCVI